MDQNKIAVDVFNKLAKTYQDKFMNVDLYKDSFDFFCQNNWVVKKVKSIFIIFSLFSLYEKPQS
ncbi:MAG: hypothetical protein AB8H03_13345 [Saprospiraceae bacterium]